LKEVFKKYKRRLLWKIEGSLENTKRQKEVDEQIYNAKNDSKMPMIVKNK